jgi:nicotinamide phosphoribosyltransferase
MNPMHNTDFYKVDHRSQYPAGTEMVFSNWTARKSRILGIDKVILFGLQAYILNHLIRQWDEDFFGQDEDMVVDKYAKRINSALPDAKVTFDHVRNLHRLGRVPMEIWALPEGSAVPIGVPMFVMWNTMPKFFWLTNYLETSLSANLWGPCTSATIAAKYRGMLKFYARHTGGDPSFVDWQGHDFSYRGMYGDYAAALSGAAHLLSFNGTDTIPAIDFLESYYFGIPGEIGGSVRATEHSVMSMGGKESEIDTYRRIITELYPTGIVSIVSDTWNYWNVLTKILPALKSEILARDGKVVIRPDSGDPVKILTGDPEQLEGSPARKGSFQVLWEIFGGVERFCEGNAFKHLDPHVGLIYGDSITLERAEEICHRLYLQRFVPNVVLGIGSYTYQMVTRDTFGFALKSTAGIVNGELREIFKDPITDDGTKKSAKGLLAVDENFKLKQVKTLDEVRNCAFRCVFKDGVVPRDQLQTLRDIRKLVRG